MFHDSPLAGSELLVQAGSSAAKDNASVCKHACACECECHESVLCDVFALIYDMCYAG